MAGFNFGGFANTTGVASDRRLRPYTISKVKFAEAKRDTLHSEKNNTDYQVLKVRFEGEAGMYEENLFLPSTSGKDVERTPNNFGGENPSNADRAMMFVAHVLSVLNHDGFEKLKKIIGKMNSFEQVADATVKLLNEKKGTECYLKLVGRNSDGTIFASLPFYASISKDGDAYVSNNFLSLKDDLSFSPSEDKKRREYENAKPSPAPAPSALDAVQANTPSADNSDIDNSTQEQLDAMIAGL